MLLGMTLYSDLIECEVELRNYVAEVDAGGSVERQCLPNNKPRDEEEDTRCMIGGAVDIPCPDVGLFRLPALGTPTDFALQK